MSEWKCKSCGSADAGVSPVCRKCGRMNEIDSMQELQSIGCVLDSTNQKTREDRIFDFVLAYYSKADESSEEKIISEGFMIETVLPTIIKRVDEIYAAIDEHDKKKAIDGE